ncbi:allophanate hydrolase-related protein [Mycolicibacterium mengxianglii]|uniref:allophanate hydrolase-related protein n=1 Tax=Mycolicibacterium mengxianglii TaxID=2736649 RepID=UPI001E468A1E|nr:gamma-glutamylcyclotransferase [Mycolicibacterium mengxianglii]
MFLNGTAMSGQKDHGCIAGRARFLGPATTAPNFRFFAIRDEFPGLFPVDNNGAAIVGELYEMTDELLFDVLLPQEPRELEIGTITLADGSEVRAMILQPERIHAGDKVVDIADFGGFRAYQAHLAANSAASALLGL